MSLVWPVDQAVLYVQSRKNYFHSLAFWYLKDLKVSDVFWERTVMAVVEEVNEIGRENSAKDFSKWKQKSIYIPINDAYFYNFLFSQSLDNVNVLWSTASSSSLLTHAKRRYKMKV